LPGNTVIWRGMARLTDIELGFTLAVEIKVRRTRTLYYYTFQLD
jgi:hypothetical protein